MVTLARLSRWRSSRRTLDGLFDRIRSMKTEIFPGVYESLDKIAKYVSQAAHKAGLDPAEVYQVQLAVDEACCNIIDHAYGGEGIGDIQLSLDVSNSNLTIVLKDQGEPFDPSELPPPQLNVPLEKMKVRGVGFYLMHKLMDEVRYEAEPGRGNTLTLVKRR